MKPSVFPRRNGRIALFRHLDSAGSASQSEALTVAVGFSPRGGSAKTGVAERRLKGSIGSSVQASLRDAHSFHTIIPWAQAHGYHHVVTPRLPQN